ncbi:hypothetical protein YE149_04174, partial [Yersinia enterocolitica subsp. palearctica YE-149]
DDRNSLGGFHHGSGAIAPIKKPDIWLQYLSAIFKKKHLVYWERPYMARHEPSGTLIFTKGIRRFYDLPVFTAAGTLSITSNYCLLTEKS